jgi:hypothetical protein
MTGKTKIARVAVAGMTNFPQLPDNDADEVGGRNRIGRALPKEKALLRE